jgi:hypothetical protein
MVKLHEDHDFQNTYSSLSDESNPLHWLSYFNEVPGKRIHSLYWKFGIEIPFSTITGWFGMKPKEKKQDDDSDEIEQTGEANASVRTILKY